MSVFPFSVSSPLPTKLSSPEISWVFHPGMLFDSELKWWSPGKRRSPHEGLDLCLLQAWGQNTYPVPAGTAVTPIAPGRVTAIIPDFLDQTVIQSHGLEEDEGREWISLLAHIRPHPDLSPGTELEPGQTVGWTAAFSGPPGMLCHLHLSLGLVHPPYDASLTWPDFVRREHVQFIDPLPLLPVTAIHWPDSQAWFEFVSQLTSRS